MIYLLLFVLPAVFSMIIKDKLFKEKLNVQDTIYIFVKYILYLNLIIFGCLFLYSKGGDSSISYALDNISFIFKVLLLSVFCSIIIPIVEEYIKKNINIKINFKYEETKNEKKKK